MNSPLSELCPAINISRIVIIALLRSAPESKVGLQWWKCQEKIGLGLKGLLVGRQIGTSLFSLCSTPQSIDE